MSVVNARNAVDAALAVTHVLPGSATTVYSDSIDLSAAAIKPEGVEIEIIAPALTNTQIPNAGVCTYNVQDSADDSSFATIATGVLVQTGAGAGVATSTKRFGIPSNVRRYVRLALVGSGSIGDASASSATFQLVF